MIANYFDITKFSITFLANAYPFYINPNIVNIYLFDALLLPLLSDLQPSIALYSYNCDNSIKALKRQFKKSTF